MGVLQNGRGQVKSQTFKKVVVHHFSHTQRGGGHNKFLGRLGTLEIKAMMYGGTTRG